MYKRSIQHDQVGSISGNKKQAQHSNIKKCSPLCQQAYEVEAYDHVN